MTEEQLTAECFQWAWKERPQTRRLLFHIPNEGERNPVRAGQLKAMGMVPGIMDFVFVWAERPWGIEMKLPGQKLSQNQIKVHMAWNAYGHSTFICYSLAGFNELIDQIIADHAPHSPICHKYL